MKYTRKPQETRMVTFSVSWIDQEITIPDIDCMPTQALVPLTRDDDPEPIIGALPDEISTLLVASSGKEFQEFMREWGKASEKAEKDTQRTESIFERLIRGLQ